MSQWKQYDIFIIENCSLASKGEIEVRNDTLNLIYKGETSVIIDTISYKKHNDGSETLSYTIEEEITISECDCAFNLKYKIEGLNRKKEYIVLANNIRIEKTKHKYPIIKKSPTFDIIDNDTVNYVDIYGHKQGLHIWKHNNKLYSKIKFKDNEEFSGLLSTRYNFNGFEKIEMYMDKGKYTETKYYKNGKLFKICDTQESFFEEGTNCKYLKWLKRTIANKG